MNGFNSTIFMYGQTTSGKTFTMLGSPENPGVLPCSLRDIFNTCTQSPGKYIIYCSYTEIYNENIFDLLQKNSPALKLMEDSKFGVSVNGAKRVRIQSFDDGITLKDFGEENRKYRETLYNECSSRSHSIFRIYIQSAGDKTTATKYSVLNLVDLAGSERLNDYDSKNEVSGETGYINKSLFVLSNVINRLAENKKLPFN